jgi:hypothetical protein
MTTYNLGANVVASCAPIGRVFAIGITHGDASNYTYAADYQFLR